MIGPCILRIIHVDKKCLLRLYDDLWENKLKIKLLSKYIIGIRCMRFVEKICFLLTFSRCTLTTAMKIVLSHKKLTNDNLIFVLIK